MNDTQPIITKRKLLIALVVILILFGAGTFALLYKGPSQEIPDSTEPMLDFAAPGSKIAGIQVLVKNGGLSSEQYTSVYQELNKKLPEMEPDSNYFDYEEGSLSLSTTQKVDEDGQDAEEEIWLEDVVYDLLLFEMTSDAGTKYKVTVNRGENLDKAETKIEKVSN